MIFIFILLMTLINGNAFAFIQTGIIQTGIIQGAGANVGNNLLLEDGTYLLLEDGGKLILE